MARKIEGMVVVITGASSGIGRALAVELSRAGAKLALAARRLERLEQLNRELGGQHLCVQTDVSSSRQCAELIARAHQRFGRIDTLVCNAGFGIVKEVAATTTEDYRRIFATNLFGTTDCIESAMPILRGQDERDRWRGQIMLVSSIVARRGIPQLGAYSATKAAQLSIAEALRIECRDERIAVTSVHPIGTETEFSQASESGKDAVRPSTPRTHMQSAELVARAMVRAIRRPKPEVWTSWMGRHAVGLSTVFPRVFDMILARYLAAQRKKAGKTA